MLNKKTFLFLAILWTVVITFLSLATLDSSIGSEIKIPNKDKMVHFVFYFLFVVLWSFYVNFKTFKFKKVITSKVILKQRLLDLMRLPSIPKSKEQLYYRTLIGYLHNIEVPINIFINKNDLKKDKNNNTYMLLNKQNIYIEDIN